MTSCCHMYCIVSCQRWNYPTGYKERRKSDEMKWKREREMPRLMVGGWQVPTGCYGLKNSHTSSLWWLTSLTDWKLTCFNIILSADEVIRIGLPKTDKWYLCSLKWECDMLTLASEGNISSICWLKTSHENWKWESCKTQFAGTKRMLCLKAEARVKQPLQDDTH